MSRLREKVSACLEQLHQIGSLPIDINRHAH